MVIQGISIIVACFVVSCLATKLLLDFLRKKQVMDIPNDRSNHKIPTPRGGGIAINIALLPAWFFISMWLSDTNRLEMMIPLIGALALALISFADDVLTLRALSRFVVQIGAVAGGVYALYLGESVIAQGIFGAVLPIELEMVLVGLGWLWFINLYNFMDGIDGITTVETVSIALGIIAITFIAGYGAEHAFFGLAIIGSVLGFVTWNWHPAKIFMGDVGSIVLGYVLGFLMIRMALEGSLLPMIMLSLYYLVDSTYTLLKRLVKKEKIWQAHSQHFYQQAVRKRNLAHHTVCYMIMIGNGMFLMLAASMEKIRITYSEFYLLFALGSFLVAILILVMILIYFSKNVNEGMQSTHYAEN
ncbi:MAG: glycosyltransferase family 4 protein [Rickettsiales bacterium]|nr:glycosyltransferase family 4 protein [Rickettsiales bacterium]